MSNTPKFSVIAVDYEHHVPRDGFRNGIKSLADQTFKDFELIICHDGPKTTPYEEEINFEELGLNPIIINTPEHMHHWGHFSRDMAMRQASGQYFVQFNIDNVFYPDAFEKISNKLDESEEDIVIFQVRHFKAFGGNPFRGIPPVINNIDCMQLVASRKIWEDINFWYRYEGESDGLIYQDMCSRYPWVELPECLGDNY